MQINSFFKAASVGEAYEKLQASPQNCILGGCTFLRKTSLNIDTAIDLSGCGLDTIRETENEVLIGAYTSFRDIEISPVILREFGDTFKTVLEHLVGVQLRSHITIGAHVYSRYGFSDMIPALLVTNARVRLHRAGEMTLSDFMRADIKTIRGDILTEIILPKEKRQTKIQMVRLSYSDYSVFCLAVSRVGNDWIFAAGARPGPAVLAEESMAILKTETPQKEDIPALAEQITAEFRFGSNLRGSAEYRKKLCTVFARRALEALLAQ